MLAFSICPFSPEIHTLNVILHNSPGGLARILVLLQHQNVNVENAKVWPVEDTEWSEAILRVSAPVTSLTALEKKIARMIKVLSVEVIPAPGPPATNPLVNGRNQ